MEINTSGFRKEVGKQYPSNEIIKEMYNLDIPILLGSDAHDPGEIAWEFDKTLDLIKNIGYNQLSFLALSHLEAASRYYLHHSLDMSRHLYRLQNQVRVAIQHVHLLQGY